MDIVVSDDTDSKHKLPEKYHVYVIGTAHFTKNIPDQLYLDLALEIDCPVVLLGGKEHVETAQRLSSRMTNAINVVGDTSLTEAFKILQDAEFVIGPDTGLSHAAAALKKKQIVVYGSTHSSLGFTPYRNPNARIFEHKSLSCQPCTKQGRSQCPKGHFKCMLGLDKQTLIEELNDLIEM